MILRFQFRHISERRKLHCFIAFKRLDWLIAYTIITIPLPHYYASRSIKWCTLRSKSDKAFTRHFQCLISLSIFANIRISGTIRNIDKWYFDVYDTFHWWVIGLRLPMTRAEEYIIWLGRLLLCSVFIRQLCATLFSSSRRCATHKWHSYIDWVLMTLNTIKCIIVMLPHSQGHRVKILYRTDFSHRFKSFISPLERHFRFLFHVDANTTMIIGKICMGL